MAEKITSHRIAKKREQEAMEILHELRRWAASQKDREDIEPVWRESAADYHKRPQAGMVAIDPGWDEAAVLKGEKDMERAMAGIAEYAALSGKKLPEKP